MANEATLVWRKSNPVNMTISNTAGIEKGTLLKIADPFTASASTAADDIVGGIAAVEKIANDGTTQLAVYRDGIFKMTLSGSCTIGDCLGTSATANMVKRINGSLSGSRVLGFALETGTTGETILVDVIISPSPSN